MIENDDMMSVVMTAKFGEVCAMMAEIANDREDKTKVLTFDFTDVQFTLECKIKENENAE